MIGAHCWRRFQSTSDEVIAMRNFSVFRLIPALAAAVAGAFLLLPHDALAWGRVGVFIGVPPVVFGPPVYAPPPRFYYPPPVYYPAPSYYVAPVARPAPPGFTCYAGPYVCPLEVIHPVNAPCSCPAYGGRVGGVTR